MKALVLGSFNIDKVYLLKHLPDKGQTLTCETYEIHVGGKGLNQAVSLLKAGADVYMSGAVGHDGKMLVDFLDKAGVNTDFVEVKDGYTGHAIIEVDENGQNQMILFPGTNMEITADYCDKVLENFSSGDLLLLQYETSQVEYMIDRAYEKGMIIAFNPSPYVDKIAELSLDKISYLILNEEEGKRLTGEKDTDKVIEKLKRRCPNGAIVLTLGSDGAVFANEEKMVSVPAFRVNAVDTTGAGDTFTGYFLQSVFSGTDEKTALTVASAASAIVVTKSGSAENIPEKEDVEQFLAKN